VSARFSVAALAVGLCLAGPVHASDVGYIYGRVETVDGDVFQGQLRWGDEEAFWDDMFNADKTENDNLDYVDSGTLRHLRARHWGGIDLPGLHDPELTHLFAVRFGDLKRLDVRRGEDVIAAFRNGQELRLHGGSNDIGAKVTVVDPKEGIRELDWHRIRTVEFMETPSRLHDKLGEPIYGRVKAGRFDYTGRIQWDNDEALSIDKLDGYTRDGKMSIAFADIASIRKQAGGSEVTLRTGRTVFLRGTNDVNADNRGIVITVPRLGSVKVGWRDFEEARFTRAPDTGPAYSEFARPHDLAGTVTTRDGDDRQGRIIYDLDESWDFELLQGTNGDTEYLIPFRDIRSIRPEGSNRAEVELRMGVTIELEDGQDVTRRNDGLLVFTSEERKPKYVDWSDVREVVFR
jgi:hypothetical protein